MVAAISSMSTPRPSSRSGPPPPHNRHTTTTTTPTRRPLPSDAENLAPHRRHKSREVTSRYLSRAVTSNSNSNSTPAAASRRLPSPIRPRTPGMTTLPVGTPMPAAKRSQSVERPRTSTPAHGVGSAAAKMLFTSTRSLSVSFQGESFSLHVSKAKPAPSPAPAPVVRRGTPERRKTTPTRGDKVVDQVDNSKKIEQHRWPARLRPDNFLSRSLDLTDELKKLGGSPGSSVVRDMQKSMVGMSSKNFVDGKQFPDSGSTVAEAGLAFGSVVPFDSVSSDSVSSESTSGGRSRRNLMFPAKFWQGNNNSNKLKNGRPSELVSPMAKNAMPKGVPLANYFTPKRLSTDSPLSSPKSMTSCRSLSSPQRGASRPASPSKLSTSYSATPSRGLTSPARARTGATGTTNSSSGSTTSFLAFAADVRRSRIGENKIEDAHFLRLLYNRLLQWRFVNARANAASTVQILMAEKILCDAWESTSQLYDSVRDKKMLLQTLRQDLKLLSILNGQMKHIDEWTTMDLDHLNSLLGVTAALKATTLRLPVIGGARADLQNVKEAIGSAVDVMQAMIYSVCPLSMKVDGINSLVAELSNMVSKEQRHLDECRRLLSGLAVLQVTDCSLCTHIIQLSGAPSTSSMTALV